MLWVVAFSCGQQSARESVLGGAGHAAVHQRLAHPRDDPQRLQSAEDPRGTGGHSVAGAGSDGTRLGGCAGRGLGAGDHDHLGHHQRLPGAPSASRANSPFQLDIYISEMWLDPALDFSRMNPCKYNLSLNSDLLKDIWTPNSCSPTAWPSLSDLGFINSKTAAIHESPFPNIFLLIYANGSGG